MSEISVGVLDYPRTGSVLQFRGTLAPTRKPPRPRALRGRLPPYPRISPAGRSAGQIFHLTFFGLPDIPRAVEKCVAPSGRRRSAGRAAATAPPSVFVALEGPAAGRAEVQHFRDRLIWFAHIQGAGGRVGSGRYC